MRKNFKFVALFLIFSFSLLVFRLNDAHATLTTCQEDLTTYARAQGLISSAGISPSSKFGNPTKTCIIDSPAAFTLAKKDQDYTNLKSYYYTQKQSSSYYKTPNTTLPSPLSGNGLYNFTTDLVLGSITETGVNVIFVDGNLTINNNITVSGASSGLVFVTSGNIIIAPTVVNIDSVLISNGIIYTAGAGCLTSKVTASQLAVNGGLVSLDQNKKIQFCRTLADNTSTPAEVIVLQAKYLPILKDLFSQTQVITTEDTTFALNVPISTTPPNLDLDFVGSSPFCRGTPNNAFTTQQVSWSANDMNGVGSNSYTYTWTGTAFPTPQTGQNVTASYSTTGTKNATVTVTDNQYSTLTATATCSISVSTMPTTNPIDIGPLQDITNLLNL